MDHGRVSGLERHHRPARRWHHASHLPKRLHAATAEGQCKPGGVDDPNARLALERAGARASIGDAQVALTSRRIRGRQLRGPRQVDGLAGRGGRGSCCQSVLRGAAQGMNRRDGTHGDDGEGDRGRRHVAGDPCQSPTDQPRGHLPLGWDRDRFSAQGLAQSFFEVSHWRSRLSGRTGPGTPTTSRSPAGSSRSPPRVARTGPRRSAGRWPRAGEG